MITISLCMIVKNESAILARCLSSYQEVMDEIIIIDTGSTDNTKEIARKYTDQVYDFAWTGNFSDARNYSFSKATKEYIFCADADEVLDDENRKRFLLLKEILLPEIDIVQMYYVNKMSVNTIYNFEKEYRPKLYRRMREFIWEGAIHEAVRLNPIVYDSDVAILHLAQGDHSSRDLAAFVRIGESGTRLDKRLHNIYARELAIAGSDEDFIRAIPIFSDSMEDTTRSDSELKEASYILARAYRLQGDIPNFFKYAMKIVAMDGCCEICMELGDHYRGQGDLQEASVWYYNAAFETECILKLSIQTSEALLALADCCEALGDPELACSYRDQAKSEEA
ncbi:MAG: glycosyltransferase family 2 protein [Lachnospiraceae bacterium]|nr:glycosyltransferase family 2 protein [Lachnospiraceae bacterium]